MGQSKFNKVHKGIQHGRKYIPFFLRKNKHRDLWQNKYFWEEGSIIALHILSAT